MTIESLLCMAAQGEADYFEPPHPIAYYTSELLGPILFLFAVQLGASGCFVAVEGWDYGTALYHCFITASVRRTCGLEPAASQRVIFAWSG
jgi:hypothetical protein